MKRTPLRFEDLSTITCRADLATFEGGDRILILSYEGEYRDGSAGNPDAIFMLGEAQRYSCGWNSDGLVFDLSRLKYRWGDGIVRVLELDPEPLLPMQARAVVAGEESRPGLSSLLPETTLYSSQEEAVVAARAEAIKLRELDEEFEYKLKMYILVKASLEPGHAITAACHAAVATAERFSRSWEVRTWLGGVFRKVVCRVSEEEFERAKSFPDHVVMTESALGGREVALGFKPRTEWPKAFRFYKLY